MSDTNMTGSPLVIATSKGDYYVIPRSALAQFAATTEQRAQIDEEAGDYVKGSFVTPTGAEAAARSDFASEGETTVIGWFSKS